MSRQSGIYNPNFLGKALKKNELIPKLKDLHEALQCVSQEPAERPENLDTISAQLVSARILGHIDKEVTLLATCCIVDILRIYAPEAPYNDEQLCRIFESKISHLRGLGNHDASSGIGLKIFYILNSLAVVRSGVVLIYLAQGGTPGAADLVVSFFDCLVSIMRPGHTQEVTSHVEGILQYCMEESETFPQDILDILLIPLLPAKKVENIAAYNFCQGLLRRTVGFVQQSICNFVNEILIGNKCKESELTDHIYPLIFELHKVSPMYLMNIIPNLCTQLQAEEEDVRLKSTKLLGRLFASQHADYGIEFTRNFSRDFLGRFVDVCVSIRLEMIENGALIILRKPTTTLRAMVE
eukprot:gene3697-7356_t